MTTITKKQPVGPVDVMALLADIKAGKASPRTNTVEICVNPNLANEADEILDQIEAIQARVDAGSSMERSLSEAAPEYAEELAELEARHSALFAQYKLSLVKFTFRGQEIGDRLAILNAMAADNADINDPEQMAPYGTAQYMIAPTTMTPAEVRNLAVVIGWHQFSKLCECWQVLVFGEPSAPLSQRPSRGPEIAKF